MDKFYVALATSLVSVLAFIAYKHSRAYRNIYSKLVLFSSVSLIAVGIYDLGGSIMYSGSQIAFNESKKLTGGNLIEAQAVVQKVRDAYSLPTTQITLFCLGWVAYLTLLRFLPEILDLSEDVVPDKKE